ncbi:tRNA1(Val) (adenine(37)-N6)-methyltransferase [Vineibacter terrae]|uniref:tRNA1(Val) (adenine(37)-N6)-methyltransferase n=1 Tax=Vineibacter terrae TaxID=2586908 RepID=UPI002E36A46F|nr:methyltransferase [Vineibacter terrae]HEX2888829.1 methyltransferase [Vineibacter terrae]
MDTGGAGRAGLAAELLADCTDDRLLGGRVRLLQPARGYRVAIDAVLLAASVPVASGQRVIDVGCGVGAAALCLLARAAASGLSGVDAVGLDVQPRFVALARCNAERNGVAGAMTVVEGDVAAPPPDLGLFDQVMTNPPYLSAAQADPPPDRSKALATVESTADLAAWLGFCRRLLRPGGTLSLVHRADRRAELLRLLRPLAADIAVLPLLPQAGAAPRRLLIRARQGTGGQVRDLPGLVLHRKAGGYTPEAEAILRDAAGLDLG